MNARALRSNVSELDPADQCDPESGADGFAAPVSRSLKRILLVDDQAHVLRVMRLSLDRNGYEVETALNTEIALRLLHESPCDAIITGVDLPISTARQLCESVQQQLAQRAPLCLIATSLSADSEELVWIEEMPNTELLPSPLSLRWVVARLSQFFGTF